MLKLHFKSDGYQEQETNVKKEEKGKAETDATSNVTELSEAITLDLQALIGIIQGVNLGNSGTWLDPIKVDNFVEISHGTIDPGSTTPVVGKTAGNNRVLEFDVEAIADAVVEGTLEGSNDQDPLDFIEIKRIDKGQWAFPDRNIWDQIFTLEKHDHFHVSPSGSLFITADKKGKIRIKFQSADVLEKLMGGNEFFALSYSLCFHVTLPFQRDPFYCLVDPIVQVRSNPQ